MMHGENKTAIPARERIAGQERERLMQKLEQGVQRLDGKDIGLLKDFKDPRVFFKMEQGSIELVGADAYKELDALAPQTFE